MRIGMIIALSAAMLLIIGCVPSLHPLYNSKSGLATDARIIGTWANDDSSASWQFEQADSNTYELLYAEDESAAHFVACLVRLDNKLFIDTYPDEEIANDFYKLHLVPAHIIGRIWIEGDSIRLDMLDGDWLRKMIDKGSISIAHELVDDGMVLTASSDELQKLVKKYTDIPDAFSNMTVLHKQK
jgi:hypothetical protein